MAIKHYKRGEHPAGFIGFRVAVSFGGKYRQKYISTSDITEEESAFTLRKLEAQLLEQQWKQESLLQQYQVSVTSSHPNTKPGRGLGVHGLTMAFSADKRGTWSAAFVVQNERSVPERFTFANRLYSDAWRDAVNRWGAVHDVLPEDLERVLNNPPDPARFKELRRIMVEEGHDVPVGALHHVFREQRERLKGVKPIKEAPAVALPGVPKVDDKIAREMEEWFNSVASKSAS